jgi:hypothetical protein
VNKPSPIEPAETLIFVTPLCAARMKRRHEIEAVLLRHGAKGNIFTHAFLDDLEALREDLARAPPLAQASDRAVDALMVLPQVGRNVPASLDHRFRAARLCGCRSAEPAFA